ncbi:hypothetical protein PAAG_08635 [Paracoccidioides lutzii Pb01]|uniref:Uncharacterized protein n=1 Tax=Paracoccidioides lutzii (strain ATCC MYA-826 / Pb01) TaxID=502779 RepID=C1HCZ4_PARBA|nr:hypothetical protein PAAG_08635 [Paracoccidioides lutzii Pb01]EEH39366.1 hypothetical protein PAAG_08635 [Paracoccidioides lutzii Pb01]
MPTENMSEGTVIRRFLDREFAWSLTRLLSGFSFSLLKNLNTSSVPAAALEGSKLIYCLPSKLENLYITEEDANYRCEGVLTPLLTDYIGWKSESTNSAYPMPLKLISITSFRSYWSKQADTLYIFCEERGVKLQLRYQHGPVRSSILGTLRCIDCQMPAGRAALVTYALMMGMHVLSPDRFHKRGSYTNKTGRDQRPFATLRISYSGDIVDLNRKLYEQGFSVHDVFAVLDLGYELYEIGLTQKKLAEFQQKWREHLQEQFSEHDKHVERHRKVGVADR